EVAHALHLWCVNELAIESVRPTVITAAKHFARAASSRRRPGPVPANVVEAAQLTILPARHEQRLAGELERQVVAWSRHLLAPADDLPGAKEDSLALTRQMR